MGREATHLKEADEIAVLSMDVTNDLDGRRKFNERWLAEEYFTSGETESRDLWVLETNRLVGLARVADVEEPSDHVVYIEWATFVSAWY